MDGWTPKVAGSSIAVDDQSPASNGTAQDADNRQLRKMDEMFFVVIRSCWLLAWLML